MDAKEHPSGIQSNPFVELLGIELADMDDVTSTATLEMRPNCPRTRRHQSPTVAPCTPSPTTLAGRR